MFLFNFNIGLFMQALQKDLQTLSLIFISLFILQIDNDLIDNDSAGQYPAAQAVVLIFYHNIYIYFFIISF